MMLTIHGLPLSVKYQDLKVLIREKCNITDFILDNLVSEGDGTKKVRIGLADEREGTYFIKCLDGLRMAGNMLRVLPVGPSNPQQNFDQRGGYPPRNDYPNQSGPGPNYSQQGRPTGPDMMRGDHRRQETWGSGGNTQWTPSQHPQGPNQMNQAPVQQNNFNYQQGMNAPYGQDPPPQGGRPDIRPQYDQRDQFQGQGRPVPRYEPDLNNQAPLRPDVRSHVLRSVEIVDEPMNRPITQPRYPGNAYEPPQQKPVTIMKDNFQGPQYNLDRPSGQPYPGQGPQPHSHHRPGHPGPHHAPPHQSPGMSPWSQPIQPDKPPFGKPSPNFDRKYPEADKRQMMAKPPIEPPRNIHDYGAKPGPRFSPRRDVPDKHVPRFSPRRDMPDPHGKPGPRFSPRRDPDPHSKPGPRFSPRRDMPDLHGKPGPRFSPRRDIPDPHGGRRMPSPGRRMPSPGRRMPSPGRRMPSPGRRMPSPGRRMPSPGRRMPSPGKRMSPGRGRSPPHKRHDSPGRYSPSRRHMDKPGDKYGPPDGRASLKDVRPAYDPPTQAPNQAMYAGGYRPSLHENVQYPIPGARPMEPRPSSWQERDKAFPPGGKKEDDRRMPKFEPRIDAELNRSPSRKSRSPIRRDRSPVRDRYKKHSPSPRSPRRSWALEKRHSPEIRDAPPPPMWPGQPRQEEPFRRFPDRVEEDNKHMPVWEPRRPEDERRFENPLRVRTDLGGRPPMEPSPRGGYKPDDRFPPRDAKFEPREPKFEPREPKFEPRDPKFEPRDNREREGFRRAKEMLKRFDREEQRQDDMRPMARHDSRDEFAREEFPRREEERKVPKMPDTFNKEFEDVYKRAQELKKRSEELRRREDRREHERRDEREPNFERKYDHREEHRDDRPFGREDREPEWKTVERRPPTALSPSHKAKREKAIDEISNKIIDKHGSHFTGEMRNRVFEEMRIVVGKTLQAMFGYKDVSFIEMVVKFNAKYDQKAEVRMFNDVLTSLPSHFRSMHANKRPANDSRPSEIPAKSARRDHDIGVNRERPMSRPVRYPYKTQEEPKLQRKTIRNQLGLRKEEEKPKLSKELEKKIAETQEPTSDGYELNQLMSQALENELQDIMIKVWQELPDSPPSEAEKVVADKFRNELGDDLKNALGLNVTKRILNVSNQLNVKIEFDTKPYGPCVQKFLRWLNCSAMRRVLDGQHNYMALLRKQSDFDRVVSKGRVRIGTLKAKITPYYKFTKCPPKLKTIYKVSKKTIQEIEKEKNEKEKQKNKESTDVNKKPDAIAGTKTDAKKATDVPKPGAKKTEQVVKTEAKKTEQAVKTEAKKTEQVTKPEAKKVVQVAKPEAKKVVVTKVTPTKSQAAPKKDANTKTTSEAKPKDNKPTEKSKTVSATKRNIKSTPNKGDKKRQRKQSDFDELNDEDILALMSNAIVLDECVGSDED